MDHVPPSSFSGLRALQQAAGLGTTPLFRLPPSAPTSSSSSSFLMGAGPRHLSSTSSLSCMGGAGGAHQQYQNGVGEGAGLVSSLLGATGPGQSSYRNPHHIGPPFYNEGVATRAGASMLLSQQQYKQQLQQQQQQQQQQSPELAAYLSAASRSAATAKEANQRFLVSSFGTNSTVGPHLQPPHKGSTTTIMSTTAGLSFPHHLPLAQGDGRGSGGGGGGMFRGATIPTSTTATSHHVSTASMARNHANATLDRRLEATTSAAAVAAAAAAANARQQQQKQQRQQVDSASNTSLYPGVPGFSLCAALMEEEGQVDKMMARRAAGAAEPGHLNKALELDKELVSLRSLCRAYARERKELLESLTELQQRNEEMMRDMQTCEAKLRHKNAEEEGVSVRICGLERERTHLRNRMEGEQEQEQQQRQQQQQPPPPPPPPPSSSSSQQQPPAKRKHLSDLMLQQQEAAMLSHGNASTCSSSSSSATNGNNNKRPWKKQDAGGSSNNHNEHDPKPSAAMSFLKRQRGPSSSSVSTSTTSHDDRSSISSSPKESSSSMAAPSGGARKPQQQQLGEDDPDALRGGLWTLSVAAKEVAREAAEEAAADAMAGEGGGADSPIEL